MDGRYEKEDSDVNIAVISGDDQPVMNNFDVEDPPLLSAPAPWWRSKVSNIPKDWYEGAVREANNFSWEITEPNHVVTLIL